MCVLIIANITLLSVLWLHGYFGVCVCCPAMCVLVCVPVEYVNVCACVSLGVLVLCETVYAVKQTVTIECECMLAFILCSIVQWCVSALEP